MSKEVKRVNMNGSQDPYYRYTMPCITVKVEGTTKMIKSVLTNIEDVCRAIGRPPDYLITYLGQELSANSKIEKETGKAYVTGSFEERKVQDIIFKFITETVTCGNCKNPETTCNIEGKKKNMTLYLTCKGCGGRTDLDSSDRFVKYMILHPPTDANYGHAKTAAGSVGSVMADLTKMDEEKKKKKKKKEEEGGGDSDDDEDKKEKKKKKKKEKERGSDSADEDGEKKEKKEKKKKKDKDRDGDDSPEDDKEKKDKKDKKDKKKKKDKDEKDNDSWDDDWGEDTSEDAVAARKAALAGGKDADEQEDKMSKMAAKMDKLMEKSAGKKKDSSDEEPTAAAGDDDDSDVDLDDI